MKKNIILLTLVFSLLMGCNDFLKEDPKSFSAASVFFKSEDGIKQALNGVYSVMLQYHTWKSRNYVMTFEITTDGTTYLGTVANRIELEQYTFTAENGFALSVYQSWFAGVYNTNLFLDQIPDDYKSFTNDEFINRVTAEVRFFRAMFYFYLVQVYGPVPLLNESNYEEELNPSNSTVSKIYDQIVEDLIFAEKYLPNWKALASDEKLRVTRGAAKAALAKVYLTRATSDAAQSSDYANAAAKAKDVIDNEGYELWDDYLAAFHPDNEHGKEDIFSNETTSKKYGWTGATSAFSDAQPLMDIYGKRGYNNFCITEDLYNKFEKGDKRLNSLIKGAYKTVYKVTGDTTTYYTPNNNAYPIKYGDPYNTEPGYQGTNMPVLRYADVLLMYAEAENELNGPTSAAYAAINKVRKRAGIPDLSGLSKEGFRQALRDERYKELYYEAVRWFDLVRWGILKERVEAVKKGVTVNWPKNKYLPIPQSEIDTNPNLIQNEGY